MSTASFHFWQRFLGTKMKIYLWWFIFGWNDGRGYENCLHLSSSYSSRKIMGQFYVIPFLMEMLMIMKRTSFA